MVVMIVVTVFIMVYAKIQSRLAEENSKVAMAHLLELERQQQLAEKIAAAAKESEMNALMYKAKLDSCENANP